MTSVEARVLRYILRPPLALHRLSMGEGGRLLYSRVPKPHCAAISSMFERVSSSRRRAASTRSCSTCRAGVMPADRANTRAKLRGLGWRLMATGMAKDSEDGVNQFDGSGFLKKAAQRLTNANMTELVQSWDKAGIIHSVAQDGYLRDSGVVVKNLSPKEMAKVSEDPAFTIGTMMVFGQLASSASHYIPTLRHEGTHGLQFARLYLGFDRNLVRATKESNLIAKTPELRRLAENEAEGAALQDPTWVTWKDGPPR